MLIVKQKIRGRALENKFERVKEQLNGLANVIVIRLEVKRVGKSIYKAKQPCDFVVITPKTTWFIDTKECASNVWYPSKAPRHQVDFFIKAQRMGKKAGFLVQFTNHPAQLMRFIENFDNPVNCNSGVNFDWVEVLK